MRSKMRLKGREIISLLNELEPYFQPYRLPNCFKHFWKLPSKHHWRTSQLYREKFNILLPNINLNSLKSSLRSFFRFVQKFMIASSSIQQDMKALSNRTTLFYRSCCVSPVSAIHINLHHLTKKASFVLPLSIDAISICDTFQFARQIFCRNKKS